MSLRSSLFSFIVEFLIHIEEVPPSLGSLSPFVEEIPLSLGSCNAEFLISGVFHHCHPYL